MRVSLKEAAARITQSDRWMDLYSNPGSLSIVVHNASNDGAATLDTADATRAAEAVVRMLQAPLAIANTNITIGASIGLAAAVDGDNARALKRRADDRLYDAKRGGCGRVSSEIAAAAAA